MDGAGLQAWLLKAYRSWATRSLAVGAVATGIDVVVGLTVLNLGYSTRLSAAAGVIVGATFAFLANRYFAFREKNPRLAKPAVKFVLITGLSMLVHAQLVFLLRDRAGAPFVAAKMLADVAVFSVGQLLLLRFVVFPRAKQLGSLADAGTAPR